MGGSSLVFCRVISINCLMKEFIEGMTTSGNAGSSLEEDWLQSWSVLGKAASLTGFLADKQYKGMNPVLIAGKEHLVDRPINSFMANAAAHIICRRPLLHYASA